MPDKLVTDPPSEERTCEHFGECGGCRTQDVPYAQQLESKRADLQELMAPFWSEPILIHGSPEVWNYRNKVDFNFGLRQYEEPPPKDFERETLVGFTRPGKWFWPIDIGECLIGPKGNEALLESVRKWYRDEGLAAFNSKNGEGFLRTLLVREGKRTGERMVALFTSVGELPKESFVEAVQRVFPAQSIHWGVSSGSARGVIADEMHLLDGAECIHEELHIPGESEARKLRFRISPLSFFQTNTLGTEVLYGLIREWVQGVSPDILYDLYGGMGGIAFSCSDLVGSVRSVENVPEATRDGEINAGENGIDNVFFTNVVMKTYLQQVADSGGMESSSAVVVDPPRAGMTPKPLKRLVKAGPPNILYISCKPSVLTEELPVFLSRYEITGMQAVDLFPHTPHVELLVAMQRKS